MPPTPMKCAREGLSEFASVTRWSANEFRNSLGQTRSLRELDLILLLAEGVQEINEVRSVPLVRTFTVYINNFNRVRPLERLRSTNRRTTHAHYR